MISKGKFTKHYFEGAGRIVSKLGNGAFAQPLGITAGGINYTQLTAEQQKAMDSYVRSLGTPPGPPTQQGIYATPEFTGEPYPSEALKPAEENQEPPEGWPRNPIFNKPGDVPGPPVQFGPPIEPTTVIAGEGFTGIGLPENDIFYFHPDHLGSTSYISNKNGSISQHVEYIAFGEILFEEHSSSFSSPYLFKGKELDRETNLSYYGARYLDMKTSLWLNVDPLAEKFTDQSPYNYCFGNPLNLIDPTGMGPEDWVEKKKGDIYWDDNATSQATTKSGETYLGKNVLVGTHNRDESGNEALNTAQFDFYSENDKTGPSATITGNTVPSDITKSGTLAEGLYSAKFGHRNASKYQSELAIRIYNLDGTDGLATLNGNPNPNSDGQTLTGVLFHKGNNFQSSLFDSRGHAYSAGCQTSGSYPNSISAHTTFMNKVGNDFEGTYYLRAKPKPAPVQNIKTKTSPYNNEFRTISIDKTYVAKQRIIL